MGWVKGLPLDNLLPGERRVLNVAGREVLLINHEGEIYATGSRCPHMHAKLKDGEVTEDDTIVCPRHHSVFDLETGAVEDWVPWPPVVGRALGAVSEKTGLPVYATKVEDGTVWIEIEETE
ncbi:MAG: Rieske (2Fe-2S) protein [Anaerolineae bacterium]|jgi:nitrite reductase/ring-hydroxylating ferredoxin subunit